MPKLLQGAWGDKKAGNFLCIIKSWAFPDWLQQPTLLNRAENTKADQIESRESDGRHISPTDEWWLGWSNPIPNHHPPVLGMRGCGRSRISSQPPCPGSWPQMKSNPI